MEEPRYATKEEAQAYLDGLEVGQEHDSSLGRVRITALKRDEEGRITGFRAAPVRSRGKKTKGREGK